MSVPPVSSPDLSDLVARVRDVRCESSARTLVERLYPLVLRIVRAHLPRRSSEEDLTQEVFMKMFARIEQWRAQMPFEHWVSRVAVTTCLDALRHQKRRPELRWADLSENEAEMLDHVLHDEADTEVGDALGARELAHKLLETLNPADRLVLTMMDMEGRSVADVQTATGWSGTLVKVRAFRARRKLRKAFAALESTFSPAT
ncbi:MAG TPA: RNA polymerase sigma factor [Candidatus Saccharimonadia bacterium]|nr:RNA polymerase sigma factor [Candidatus Saccharimonadia bacterium]